MNIYGERPVHPSALHPIGRDMRRLRFKGCAESKAAVTTIHADCPFLGSPRRIAIIAGWLCLLLLVWRYFAPSTSSSTGSLTCKSSRHLSSDSITLPETPDTKSISRIWLSLESTFKAYPPAPDSLPHEPFASQAEFPLVEAIKNHTYISKEDGRTTRNRHVTVTKELPEYPVGTFKGRGIVMLAGGRYNGYAATGLGMIRETGSTLPVEVWMKDQTEEKKGWCKELAREGMVCRRLSDYIDVEFLENGYQFKILTMLFSSFDQMLFLDADNVPVRNPDQVFESKGFLDTGAVLWPDYWKHTGTPILPFVVGLTDEASELLRAEQTVESGQIVWDKKRHWKSLCLATYYNYYGPRYFYTLITQGWAGWGDKDTFPIALKSFREDYYMIPHELKTIFVNGTVEGIGMLQADPSNQKEYEPMFLHSNIIKWSPREFLCVGCASDKQDPVASSFLEREFSSINRHLKEHHRIFNIEDMRKLNIDPEPLIWKSMEHSVCKGVWKNGALCARVRDHMSKAFGYEFRSGRVFNLFGYGDQVCISKDANPRQPP